ncbi:MULTISPECIES: SIS domain-containing protein [Niallia]|jgi:fructoselysine 6-phosphate deglycase|uniref:Fructosamine deglycase n=1 Tax=Niallia circulans TaxID=1397 RepID=A0AA91TUN2_NIACI|nr:SIS domain-containing protein [Niallia circulans]AYV73497.1 SIS domain-containing protein [Niallia circulans]NRG25990.1 SIS domain-containing protein [Niallia circulans]PAD83847.1 phosphosugar isomerase [Niallia circulans]QJX64038.1 SIS domain-containing protein [Niallia circulans]
MELNQIIGSIKERQPNIKSVFFVGCGASKAELYPAKYFLEANAKTLRVSLYTANEFNYATPISVDDTSIVITCSLGGATPESVEATTKAKELGAHVIAVTHVEGSALTKDAGYIVYHGFEANYAAKMEKMTKVLGLATEILHQYEGYENYDKMIDGFGKIYELIEKAASTVLPDAKAFAEAYKDDEVIYVMSSGATHEVAYSFSICLLMEMQWINSGTFHDGEFFHGPFEVVEKDVPFLLLMNDGRTRPMDARALEFLQRFDAKTTVVDAKDFGLGSVIASEVVDYFNPMLISGVLRVYAEQLSYVRNHPLTKRRYMWKLEY